MPKILKSTQFRIDDNRVSIDIIPVEAPVFAVEEAEIEPEMHAELIVEEARRKADKIVREARNVSDEIYASLDETVRKAKDEGFEQGRAGGYVEGYNDGMAQIEELRLKAEQTYTHALNEREKLLSNVEPEIIDLVEKILDKLISSEIEINPQIIIYLIRKGLSSTTATGKIKVLVSKDDFETVKAKTEELEQMMAASSDLDIVIDHSMKKSDCVIETPFGNIDCSLGQQFNSLKKNLHYILNNRKDGNNRSG